MPRSQTPKSKSYSVRLTLNITPDTAAVLAYLEDAMGRPQAVIGRDALVRGLVDVGRLSRSEPRRRQDSGADADRGGA